MRQNKIPLAIRFFFFGQKNSAHNLFLRYPPAGDQHQGPQGILFSGGVPDVRGQAPAGIFFEGDLVGEGAQPDVR
jgi:hypothetical protein